MPKIFKERKNMVFNSDLERMKYAVKEAAADFCDMLDCVDEPFGLDYTTKRYGVEVKINSGLLD